MRSGHKTRPRHSVSEWVELARCPRAYEWKFIHPRLARSEPSVQIQMNRLGYDPSELGSRVHSCLEHEDRRGLVELEAEVGERNFRAERVISWMDWAEENYKGLSEWRELGFEVPVGGEFLVGTLDRVIENREGGFSILDYKVTRRLKTKDELVSQYKTQMDLYALALGLLEKRARDRTEVAIVNFASDGVESVHVELETFDRLRQISDDLASDADRIVNGATGVPKAGSHCLHCSFRDQCDAAPSDTAAPQL